MGKNSTLEFCEKRIYGKHYRDKFPKDDGTRTTRIFDWVHSDVNGLMETPMYRGSKYFVLSLMISLEKPLCIF